MANEQCSFDIEVIPSESCTRYYLTLHLDQVNDNQIQDEAAKLYAYILSNKILPIYEKIFGIGEYEKQLEKTRKDYLEYDYPVSFVNSIPANDSVMTSINIFGVQIHNSDKCDIHYLTNHSVEMIIDGVNSLYIFGLQAFRKANEESNSFNNLFKDLHQIINKHGYLPSDIVRTWYYMGDIENEYNMFNQARREYFQNNNIDYNENANRLPSSTCIGALDSNDISIQMDLFCTRQYNEVPQIRRVYNEKQNEANGTTYLFQSTFSRATEITYPSFTELQISGTASINEKGTSVHTESNLDQIIKTLENVKYILTKYQMDYSCFVQSTCFFKDKACMQDYYKALELMNLDGFTSTYVIADVCRDELTFELDGIAIK